MARYQAQHAACCSMPGSQLNLNTMRDTSYTSTLPLLKAHRTTVTQFIPPPPDGCLLSREAPCPVHGSCGSITCVSCAHLPFQPYVAYVIYSPQATNTGGTPAHAGSLTQRHTTGADKPKRLFDRLYMPQYSTQLFPAGVQVVPHCGTTCTSSRSTVAHRATAGSPLLDFHRHHR